ncbi:MAG: reverse transcriptase, partial [Flavobacteriales bacterium]|nr:reverse transcriptase [Flavobacteriales bacterium]MDW8431776.1 reverse transcriptase [Flavobacteriales bacterium]
MKRVVDLSHTDVKQFFLKEESYYNFDLPKYFVFENLLQKVIDYFDQKEFSNFYPKPARKKIITRKQSPAGYEDVNYKFLSNKDGKFAWRPFQLIHPELYVSLVNIITEPSNWNAVVECFKQFQSNPNIRCSSIPLRSQGPQSDKATSVSQWWLEVEQQSLE